MRSKRITSRSSRRAGVVRHRDRLKTSVAGLLKTACRTKSGKQLRRVGKATACPQSTTCSRWWARRKCAFAHPTKLRLGSLAKTIYHSDFNLIWVVQSLLAKIFRFRRRANQFYQLAPSFPGKRGASRSSRTRDGMRWTRQRRRARWSQGEVELVSGSRRAGRTALVAYGKTVWSWHPLLMSSRRRCVGPTGLGQVLIRWRR